MTGLTRIRTQRDAEPVGHALSLIPAGIRARLAHIQFVAGSDPIFAGIHRYATTNDGRSYGDTAHAVYPCHMTHLPRDRRVSTVVVPVPQEPWIVVHEIGHILDEAISFDHHDVQPVTEYAGTNGWEAFAEAFTAWLCPDVYAVAQDALAQDKATLQLLQDLAA
jgi:hypothetical protein